RFDAAVLLSQGLPPPRRAGLRARIEALDTVDRVEYESRPQALQHVREQFADEPDILRGVTVEEMPESFRVRLKTPQLYQRFFDQLCDRGATESDLPRCTAGVDLGTDERRLTRRLLPGGDGP